MMDETGRRWYPYDVAPTMIYEYDGQQFSGWQATFQHGETGRLRNFSFYLREHAAEFLNAQPGTLVHGYEVPE